MEMIEKPFHLKSRDDPAILEIMRQLNQPKTNDELPARPELHRVSGTRICPTAEESFRVCPSVPSGLTPTQRADVQPR